MAHSGNRVQITLIDKVGYVKSPKLSTKMSLTSKKIRDRLVFLSET